MDHLTPRERELVALGAALGSHCVPCIEYHIPEARKTGLSDAQISEAIRLADRVRGKCPSERFSRRPRHCSGPPERRHSPEYGSVGRPSPIHCAMLLVTL